ncbi:hypothetical protein BN8_02869 [Fibrisoma limi BUZ 3]|uniref:FlgD/Vpr Ig-like domain-containing protein n=1 Tax=Fibrisoma limi BUZ 3 TaxID=1185876 RepID=I2GIM3_9BACT|nr:T9SS type A sorting domain-containing protein [Fibrisoma limi]CCH53748.1 hypothetical protein BN8_02869 [Fibrisoma limi BUZ 3]
MKPTNLLLMGLICLWSVSVVAQKLVPHSFHYQSDTSGRDQLRFLTQVTQPTTTFLRLYFAGTQLGDNSYLVLEGTDGARQELRKPDLENWRYSSAYFNGQSVNVSLFAAPGDRNTININGVKISGESTDRSRNARQTAPLAAVARQMAATSVTSPYAKAVGRFTNGSDSYGTGWIAPNGAIVTSWLMHGLYLSHEDSFDLIEFNVPPSVGTTVMHPSPQDQYPLLIRTVPHHGPLYFQNVPNHVLIYDGWMMFDPQPNGTGLRPGERQQEYFRIATNPRNSTIYEQGEGNMLVDIFHYGHTSGDQLEGSTTYRTLRLSQTHLLPQYDYLTAYNNGDRDRFVLYSLPTWGGSDMGAPITFAGTNVAIGVHNGSNEYNLGHGRGFRDNGLRNELNDYFFSNSVYVDFDGPPSGATGEIHKPYLTANQAASSAPSGAQVYFVRGTYPGSATFNRPMTLRAAVGTVSIGASPVGARQAAGPTIPPHWLEGAPSFDRESAEDHRVRAYPNPFRDQTEIKCAFAEGSPVSVDILNTAGVSVATFTLNNVKSGQNGVQWNGTDQNGKPVPSGLYVVKVSDGRQTFTTKVLKQ